MSTPTVVYDPATADGPPTQPWIPAHLLAVEEQPDGVPEGFMQAWKCAKCHKVFINRINGKTVGGTIACGHSERLTVIVVCCTAAVGHFFCNGDRRLRRREQSRQ